MPPKGVDAQAREAMTHEIAWCLTAMQAGQNMIDAARQIEAKCYDSAKDAQDYERKVEKRLAKAAKALEDMIDKALEKIPDTADEQQKPREEEPETPTSNIKPLEIDAGQMAATAMGLFVLAHPREEGQEVGM